MQREAYLTAANRQVKTREWLEDVRSYRRTTPVELVPQKTALLLLDMQEVFLNEDSHAFVPSAPAILPWLLEFADACKAAGSPVIATRHLNTEHDAGMMGRWWRDVITADHPYAALTSGVDQAADQVVPKPQYDAFYGSDLEALLDDMQTQKLIIGGVMTHLCCETTARAAFVRGFNMVFLADGTATYTEELHIGSLRALAHGVAQIATVEEILDALRGRE